MNTKKIKNILTIVFLVAAGLITLWSHYGGGPDQDISSDNGLSLVEQTSDADESETNPPDSTVEEPEIETNDLTVAGESSENTPEHQGQTIEDTITDIDEISLDSIADYEDIVDIRYLRSMPEYVQFSYNRYSEDGWYGTLPDQSSGTKAGGHWGNYDEQLPIYAANSTSISYKEFDVNDKIDGQSRDAERFVVGDDGSVYYTYDHYDTFIQIIE